MTEAAATRGARRQRTRNLVYAFLLLIVAGGLGALRYYATAPRFVPPQPALPLPNAADYYLQAAQLLEDVPGSERLCDPAAPPIELARLVEGCHPALDALREGMRHPYATPPSLAGEGVRQSDVPAFTLACLLTARIRVAEARGDTDTAVAAAMDVLRLGSDLPRGGQMIHAVWGSQIERMGLAELAAAGSRLTARQCRSAAARLADLEARRPPLAEALRTQRARLREFLTRLSDGDPEAALTARRASYGQFDAWGVWGPRGAWNLRGAAREIDRDYARAIADAPLPRGERRPRQPARYWLARLFGPTSFSHGFDDAALARWRLLRVELCLRAYRQEHGRAPATLAALVPEYLPAVPRDPYGGGEPLRYRAGRDALAYSVGPDQGDDGGSIMSWNLLNRRPRGDRAVRLGQPVSRHQCRTHLRMARDRNPPAPALADPESDRPAGPRDLWRW